MAALTLVSPHLCDDVKLKIKQMQPRERILLCPEQRAKRRTCSATGAAGRVAQAIEIWILQCSTL